MEQWIPMAVAILAGILSIYVWYKSGKPVTLSAVQEGFVSGQSLATELAEVARMAVASSQQLKETGVIDTNEAAFDHAFDVINLWFPDLNRKIVASAVEGAYKLYKDSVPLLSLEKKIGG
jgi:hypothetical protein